MCCGEALAKTLLIVANLACVLVGIALLAVGIVGRVNIVKVHEAIPDDITSTGTFNVLIAIGAVVFLIAFLGCCGSCKSNVFMLNSYGSILIVIFVAQVALGIYAFVKIKNTHELQEKITNKMETLIEHKYSEHQKALDSIQEVIKCCGAHNFTDYTKNNIDIPKSCYQNQEAKTDLYQEGCGTKIGDLLTTYTRILGIVVITVSAVEVFGAIFAFGLANCIKDRKRTY